jgi:hypothetical protein
MDCVVLFFVSWEKSKHSGFVDYANLIEHVELFDVVK